MVDAQIHGVEPAIAWGDGCPADDALAVSAELAIASMNAVGVRAALVNWRRPYIDAYLARHPDRFGGVPFVGFPEPEPATPVEELVAALRATPGIVGVRLIVGIPDDGSRARVLREGGFDAFLGAAQRHQLPVFLTAHGFLPDIHDAVRSHPDLTFVLDHVGLQTPPRAYAPGPHLFDDLPDVLALARFPNMAVKFTGVPSLSVEPYPFEDVWSHMHRLLEAFGVERLMWGSDFTRCQTLHTYREAVDFLLLTGEVSASEKEMLFSGTIRRWLDWPAAMPS